MGNGIYIATSGAIAQSKRLDVVANNVSNTATSGFKAQRTTFREQLIEEQNVQSILVRMDTADTDYSAGSLRQTGGELDLALVGDGFFAIETPRGPRYTRAGEFRIDATGALVNGVGYSARARGGGKIQIAPETMRVTVDQSGRVFADDAEIGQLELARFRKDALTREGANMFSVEEGAQPIDDEPPVVQSGFIEKSNVNPIRGVVDMVKISRTHQALMRMIEAYQQIDSRTARSLGNGR